MLEFTLQRAKSSNATTGTLKRELQHAQTRQSSPNHGDDAMNLAEVLHQRWAADEPLNGLLPAQRVFTGMSVTPAMPLAVISRARARPAVQFADGGGLDTVGVRIDVYDPSYDASQAVLDAVKRAFDRTGFDLAGSGKVLYMRRTSDHARQEPDGTWRTTVEFDCTVLIGER